MSVAEAVVTGLYRLRRLAGVAAATLLPMAIGFQIGIAVGARLFVGGSVDLDWLMGR